MSGFMARETTAAAGGGRIDGWHIISLFIGSPAKLDCIQRLVIRPDLANVSHSSSEPLWLYVIRAWPRTAFSSPLTPVPPLAASRPPSASTRCQVKSQQRVSWLVWRVHLSLCLILSLRQRLSLSPAPRSTLCFVCLNATLKFPQDKSPSVLLKSESIVYSVVGRNRTEPLMCHCCWKQRDECLYKKKNVLFAFCNPACQFLSGMFIVSWLELQTQQQQLKEGVNHDFQSGFGGWNWTMLWHNVLVHSHQLCITL